MSATRPGHARPPVWSDSALDHLRAACVGLALLAPGALAAAEVPISVVQFPVAIDLTGLFATADAALPTQAGQWPRWESWHGLEIRYQAWRGVLALAMRGPVILAQAHVRYRLQARKGLIGALALSAGCGVDEPPRQALVGVMARLDWTPDWLLHPRFRVLPTRPLDPCELTLADIDVSPLVGRAFESRLETALGDALSGLAPRLAAMRAEAARAWLGIQTPRELTPGLWLHVQPLGVALAPPRGAEARLETSLWIAARLTLSADASPAGPPVPLPPLVPYRRLEPGLRFALSLNLDYADLSRALANRLAGQSLEIQGRTATLDSLVLRAKGEDLVLEARVGGDLAGQLTLIGRPGFDPESGSLTLDGLDYVFDAEDPEIGLAANLFYNAIRDRIQESANRLLAERTADLGGALNRLIAGALPAAVRPDLSGLRLGVLTFTVGEAGLGIAGAAEGTLSLGLARSP